MSAASPGKSVAPRCLRCGLELPYETKKGPARKYHADCAEALRKERDNARRKERRSPRRELKGAP